MYICSNCQKQYTKWQGQCSNCKEWNTIQESPKFEIRNPKLGGKKSKTAIKAIYNLKPVKLSEINEHTKKKSSLFYQTGIHEFDNALGGRLLPGQVILLGGSPGVGKSTLCLEIIERLSNLKLRVLYIAGEESPEQIKHRVDRMGLKMQNVEFLNDTNVESLESFLSLNHEKYEVLIVDSIQTLYSPNVLSSSGSVSQISESTNRIVNIAKGFGILTFIVGHITKTGDIAGPKILEHMVDTVLYFEGDKKLEFRVLRVQKNRFGPTDEAGLFKMTALGLVEIKDTKEIFDFTESEKQNSSGSVYSMALEGTRPVVVEVQALATKTYFTNPRRTTSGFDLSRLYIILAIIDKKLRLKTYEYDVYVNITGGIKISDPGLDLAVLKAIVSSIKNQIVPKEEMYFGEVGLTGEIRKVYFEEKRIKEAKRLGFKKISSAQNVRNVDLI